MQAPFPSVTNPVVQEYVAGGGVYLVYKQSPFESVVYPVPQTFVMANSVVFFADKQFPFPSLKYPVGHFKDTVSRRQFPLLSEWYPIAQVRTVAGTEGGIQFPYPSEVYPLGQAGENAGGLTQTPLVSRTKPPEHVNGSTDPGTGESD